MSSAQSSTETQIAYAWCFDHGALHRFVRAEGAWCSAAWVPLDGSTKGEALRHKQLVWGHAQFFDQLPLDRQGGLINTMDGRELLWKFNPEPESC